MNGSELRKALFEEILQARQRVYRVGKPTPLQKLPISDVDFEVWAKREDLGPIKAYKWRGAFNAMASLSEAERSTGIVAASAGNHAQGVALAAKTLGCEARIFMPRSTPSVKQREVKRHGGKWVEIVLYGDSYDDASAEAKEWTKKSGATYIHPYDDLKVMGGQGTLADEIVMSGKGPFDRVYIAIGGGGLVSATAVWLKHHWPDIKVVGVEGVDQASMKFAIESGQPKSLDYVDVFCDGTAVRQVGENTFAVAKDLIDEVVTVTNDEVCNAIRATWDSCRAVPEPSGGMPLAGVLKDADEGKIGKGEKVLVIVCGANMDFAQLGAIARRAGIGSRQQRFLRIPVPEGKGSLVSLLRELPEEISIIDVQYGRTHEQVQYPILGLRGSVTDFAQMDAFLSERGVAAEDVTHSEDAGFRIINYAPELFQHPIFVNIEFPERARAFTDFMLQISEWASLCYFNYAYSGERVGRALIGMEFESVEEKSACLDKINAMVGDQIRACKQVSPETLRRLTGGIH